MPHPAVMVHPRLAVCPALRRLPPRGAGAVGQAVRVMAAIVLLTAAAPSRAAEPARGTPLLAPVTPACISSPFGPRVLPNRPLAGTFHPGIDLPAPVGAPVRAVAAGRVIRAQRHGPGGLEMLVQHLSIEIGSPKKFIVRFDLSQTGGKCRMINVSLIIQTLVLSLNYQEPVKKLSLKRVVDKEKLFCDGKGNCRKAQ